MRFRILFCLMAILLANSNVNASKRQLATDTLNGQTKKTIHTVKIGPIEYFLPPPVDSVLLRRLAILANNKLIDEGYKKKERDDVLRKEHRNTLLIQQILAEIETSVTPSESMISTLAQMLDSSKKDGDIKSQALILNTYAVYHVNKGEADLAVRYFKEALRLKELSKDKAAMSKITVNLAAIFRMLGKYDESIAVNEYVIRANTSIKDRSKAAQAYLNIAYLKNMQQKHYEAEQAILKKALPLFQSVGDKPGRMECFIKLADIYKVQQRFSEAKWFYLQANLMADILSDSTTKVDCLIKLAEVKNAIGDHFLALEDYRKAEFLATQNNNSDKLTEIKGEIGETYLKMGNYTAAGTALKEYSQLKDNLRGLVQ